MVAKCSGKTNTNASRLFGHLVAQPDGAISFEVYLEGRENMEDNARYASNPSSLKPLPKSMLQRFRYCFVMDSTFRTDLSVDNLMPDVMVVTMPLARIPEMVEMAVAIFAPELSGSLRESHHHSA